MVQCCPEGRGRGCRWRTHYLQRTMQRLAARPDRIARRFMRLQDRIGKGKFRSRKSHARRDERPESPLKQF